MNELYVLHAEICKTLANPKRLEILNALGRCEVSVAELVRILRLPKANVSQHLAVLRSRGVVKARREGLNVYYRVLNPKIIRACNLMREVLMEHLDKSARATRKWGVVSRAGG
jgi:ArsR family transcriptional regulator, virulence genes transcriptional regulator